MDRVFALVDCNAFFCACERLFRPDLMNRPVGVLSNNDGCFVSCTKELKALGVPMVAPYFKYKDVCKKNNVAIFSSNFSLYTNMSDRVMMTLHQIAPQIEIYSIDEAFLDLTGFEKGNLVEYGREIKRIVGRDTGIPVSVGIGPTKVLAKAANVYAKKHEHMGGVCSLMNKGEQDRVLKQIDIGDVWGIGRQSSRKLKMFRINTAKDLRDFQNIKILQKVFTIAGRQIQDELKGIPCFGLELENQKKKEIISSRTFGSPVYSLQSLRESVASYASLACEKLRKQDSVCSVVEVRIHTNPFKSVPQYYAADSCTMLSHTSDTRKVIKYALSILEKLYKEGYEYKRALVKLSGIKGKSHSQLSFFEREDSLKSEQLMAVMDKINKKEGSSIVRSAACGVDNKAWRMNQSRRSKRYVSGWTEIPAVG